MKSPACLFLLFILYSCDENYIFEIKKNQRWPNSIESSDFNGKVKSIKTIDHTYKNIDISFFNSNGNVDSILSIKDEDTFIYLFAYDELNHPIDHKRFNAEGDLKYQITYIYSNDFKSVKMETIQDSVITTTYFRHFDSLGNILNQIGYSARGTLLDSLVNYYENGLRVKQVEFLECKPRATHYFIYDMHKNNIEKKTKYHEENRTHIVKYAYEFDSLKNWTKMIFIEGNDTTRTLEREIEYEQ